MNVYYQRLWCDCAGRKVPTGLLFTEEPYLETCAAADAGFFSQRTNELNADGKYMDEFERSLYNNVLSNVSLSGDHYFYENPLLGLKYIASKNKSKARHKSI